MSSKKSLEKRTRTTKSVTLTGTKSGLGLEVVGGKNINTPYTGIFIKNLISNRLAERDGQLRVGDQLLQVNADSLVGVSNQRAVEIISRWSQTDQVDFLIARDKRAQSEFHRLSIRNQNPLYTTGDQVSIDSQSELSVSTQESEPTSLDDEHEDNNIVPPPLPLSLPPDPNGHVYSTIDHGPSNIAKPQGSVQGNVVLPPLPLSLPSDPKGHVYSTIDHGASNNTKPQGAVRGNMPQSRLSVNPTQKFRLEKLLMAVKYIGVELSPQQLQTLHNKLHIDDKRKVIFLEFVEVLEKLIPTKFDQSKFILAFTNPAQQIDQPAVVSVSTMEVMQLKELNGKMKEENDRLNSMVQLLQKKNDELGKQIYPAEEEITNSDIMRELAVKDCELKKLESSNRRYQVAVDIMKQFVEDCHEALVKSGQKHSVTYYQVGSGQSVLRGDQVTGNPRPPQYLSKHAKKTNESLANDAKEALAEVNRILNNAAVLPYGWEEEYTEDGRKYFVNHAKQTTSWVHPVTRQHPPSSSRVKDK